MAASTPSPSLTREEQIAATVAKVAGADFSQLPGIAGIRHSFLSWQEQAERASAQAGEAA